MKRLFPYLTAYRKECVLAPLFKMLEAVFELFVPLVVASIIDRGIADQDVSFILSRGGILFLLALAGMGWAITAQYFAAKAATGFASRLRQALFSHVQSLSFADLDRIGTSTLITRATSDILKTQNAVNLFLRLFLRSPFIVGGAVIMAFLVDPKTAVVFVVVIPLLFVVVFLFMRLTAPLYQKVQEKLDDLTLATKEALGGGRVIRAFRREETEEEAFAKKNEEHYRLQLLAGRISSLTNPVTLVIVNAGTMAILWIGGWQVNDGVMTQGQVVALVNYMAQILVELVKLANLIVTLAKGMASANRVADVLAIVPSQEKEGISDTGVAQETGDAKVAFSHVSFRYPDAAEDTLTDIDFCANAGETIGIIGGTGAGKSTVAQLIPRFYDATGGRILVDGKNALSFPLAALRRKVGVVPQHAVLFQGTIRENLLFGNEEATDEELWEALSIAQAAEFVRQKEGGLDFAVAEGGANLSGGQRQRLTIARALARKPEILILDDAMSALDFATEAALRKSLAALTPQPVTFLVSQRISSLTGADRILVLDDGALIAQGSHEALLASCSLYREICESQMEEPKGGDLP